MIIRRARIKDEDILKEIHSGEPPWENFETYLKAIRNSGGDIFLYENKGEIELLPFNGKAHIHVLWVQEGYRGKGIGSKLLAFAEEWAKKRGLKGLSVIPEDKNAMRFYEKNGFEFKDWQVKGIKDVEGCDVKVESHYDNPPKFPNISAVYTSGLFLWNLHKKAPRVRFGDFTILLIDEGNCVNAVIYGKILNRRIVKVAECLAGKIRKRMFLQVWMKDWKILEEEGFKRIGKVEWMEKIFT
ncbi:GNAT family N-acetyltransferase [Thermococcus sp. SY098]|uniref:GNAT family N-acetyltransferase n=1 Tax=Thermococcus sp. SY098 TaxID=3111325 RepID=UPI002D774473|nr:GNAT family N-acetyltransferase [Thermococcus sp. SY098]WRS53356.1 GNAT family N-acetyltransferase [Thermococcus sp. SY098]